MCAFMAKRCAAIIATILCFASTVRVASIKTTVDAVGGVTYSKRDAGVVRRAGTTQADQNEMAMLTENHPVDIDPASMSVNVESDGMTVLNYTVSDLTYAALKHNVWHRGVQGKTAETIKRIFTDVVKDDVKVYLGSVANHPDKTHVTARFRTTHSTASFDYKNFALAAKTDLDTLTWDRGTAGDVSTTKTPQSTTQDSQGSQTSKSVVTGDKPKPKVTGDKPKPKKIQDKSATQSTSQDSQGSQTSKPVVTGDGPKPKKIQDESATQSTTQDSQGSQTSKPVVTGDKPKPEKIQDTSATQSTTQDSQGSQTSKSVVTGDGTNPQTSKSASVGLVVVPILGGAGLMYAGKRYGWFNRGEAGEASDEALQEVTAAPRTSNSE